MTISSTNRKAGPFIGNGAASVFAFSFRVFSASDLKVVRLTVSSGVENVLDINTHYTASVNADQNANPGGSITLLGGPLGSGYNLVITSDVENLQPTDLTNQGGFYPEVITDAFDRATIQIQQMEERLARSLKYPVSDPALGTELPAVAQRAGKALSFDSLGNPIAINLNIPSTVILNGAIEFETITLMKADVSLAYSNVSVGQVIHVRNGDFSYAVLASGASTYHLITNGGVKLNVLPGVMGYNVKAFGAVGDGTADDTSILQAALTAGAGSAVYVPVGTYKTNAALSVSSKTVVRGDGSNSVIYCTNGNVSQLLLNAATDCVVINLAISVSTAGTSAYIGGIALTTGADRCRIENVSFSGMSWAGVYINNSNDCIIEKCSFSSWRGSVQDAADVCIYRASSRNIIRNNRLVGNGSHGVLVQDPTAGLLPTANTIEGNFIGEHQAYGIAVYMPGTSGSGDTNNSIYNNIIQDIQGSISSNRSSGAGIYVVGAYAGGTKVIGNSVTNCCVQTLNRTLVPAGIGINGISAGVTPPVVSNNTISGMTQGDGILLSTSPGGAVISSNAVTVPSTNDGSGVGGTTLLGSGIRVNVSSNVQILDNKVYSVGTGSALFIYATGANQSDFDIIGGNYRSASAPTIRITQAGGFTTSNVCLSGVGATNTGTTNNAFIIDNVDIGVVTGCIGIANSFAGLQITNSTNIQVVGGVYKNETGTTQVGISGTCTGTLIDQSVNFGTLPSGMTNIGTGSNVNWRAIAQPLAGNWRIGDRVQNIAPATGSAKAWVCTVSGAPGTWVSEGNL